MQKQIQVPDIGDFKDVDVIEVNVAAGDRVEAEDALITLETDKATMEVPAPEAGTVVDVKIAVGDTVNEGDVVVILETADEEAEDDEPEPAADSAPAEAAPAAAADGDNEIEIRVPDIGDFAGVEVIEIGVAVGDTVAVEDSLITLESDKATMEVPSSAAGTVKSIKVSVGDTVGEGDLIVTLAGSAGPAAAASEPAAAPAPAPAAPKPASTPTTSAERGIGDKAPAAPPVSAPSGNHTGGKPHASPAVRRYARELGADLSNVSGSGSKGRITKDDVTAYVKHAMTERSTGAGSVQGGAGIPPIPAQDFSKFGEVEAQPLNRIKKISGAHLHRCWLNVPHVTQFDDADITEMEAFRQSLKAEGADRGLKMTPLIFIMKALVKALQQFPQFNASLDESGESLILKKYFHIGIAVDTPNGLMVPVIRDVDQKGLWDLAEELGDISRRAREGKLGPADLQGGCMSISSLGGIGGTAFTPIVNAPEVAILGLSRSKKAPVWDEASGQFLPRLMLPMSLSYDHRVIDGADGARFTQYLAAVLGDIRRLLL